MGLTRFQKSTKYIFYTPHCFLLSNLQKNLPKDSQICGPSFIPGSGRSAPLKYPLCSQVSHAIHRVSNCPLKQGDDLASVDIQDAYVFIPIYPIN